MYDFSEALGSSVKAARNQLKLTQNQVADMIEVDVRTIMNIENCKANPKMEVLYPLIRALKVDSHEIFNPEMQRKSPALAYLRLLIEDCSEQEAEVIIPILNAVLPILRNKDAIKIE